MASEDNKQRYSITGKSFLKIGFPYLFIFFFAVHGTANYIGMVHLART